MVGRQEETQEKVVFQKAGGDLIAGRREYSALSGAAAAG